MMLRLIVTGIWIMGVTAIAAYAGVSLRIGGSERVAGDHLEKLEHKKTQPINVPMIANGEVSGYIVARFVYLADGGDLANLSVPPDVFIADEAFRTLYASGVDFNHLEKYDLQALTRNVIEKVNHRLGGTVIKDILVEEFAFVPRGEVAQ
jgi:hypothetical protein